MFQALSQGASVSILYRNEPRIVSGRVVSVSTHMPTYNPNQPMSMFNGLVTDITVQAGSETIPFIGLPANGVVADFPAKGMFLVIDESAAYKEVDNAIATIEQDLSMVPQKEKMLDGYKKLRAEKNPDVKRDMQREKEMSDMRNELSEMKQMLSAMLEKRKEE